MSLPRLKRKFEDRRIQLISTLQKSTKMELSKQHQLYGAIKEIELFLKSIDDQIEEMTRGTDFELTNDGPEPIKERMSVAVQAAGNSTKGFFKNMYVYCSDGVHSMKRKIGLYRQVAREVKEREERTEH